MRGILCGPQGRQWNGPYAGAKGEGVFAGIKDNPGKAFFSRETGFEPFQAGKIFSGNVVSRLDFYAQDGTVFVFDDKIYFPVFAIPVLG
jgi:hypothetical protein